MGSCATSWYQIVYPDEPTGIAAQTCQQWLSEHAKQTPLAEAQTKWLADVFRSNSLRVEEYGDALSGVHTEKGIAIDSEQVCKVNPRWTLKAMAKRLVDEALATKASAVTG